MPQTSMGSAFTAYAAGFPVDLSKLNVRSYINGETSAEIPFGVAVKQGATDSEALLAAAVTDDLIGIVVGSHSYARDSEIGDTGVKPGVVMSVAVSGVLPVVVEEAVTPASAVFVRCVAGGGEQAGAFRDTQDTTDCRDISGMARYLTSAGVGGVALLEFDFTNRRA